jgi:hypothetical protein
VLKKVEEEVAKASSEEARLGVSTKQLGGKRIKSLSDLCSNIRAFTIASTSRGYEQFAGRRRSAGTGVDQAIATAEDEAFP